MTDENLARGILVDLRRILPTTTPLQRAAILEDLTQTVYDHVKFHAPEGGGLDGRSGPERQALAAVLDAVKDHRHAIAAGNLDNELR